MSVELKWRLGSHDGLSTEREISEATEIELAERVDGSDPGDDPSEIARFVEASKQAKLEIIRTKRKRSTAFRRGGDDS